jgi:hypothetical protein
MADELGSDALLQGRGGLHVEARMRGDAHPRPLGVRDEDGAEVGRERADGGPADAGKDVRRLRRGRRDHVERGTGRRLD